MQYYSEYLNDLNDSKIGIYKYIENVSYIETEKDTYLCIENNRAIHNDSVYYKNNNIISIDKRNIVSIVGILYIDSKIKYGTYNDKLLYLFKPTNKCYPHFYIPYKIKNSKNKLFCSIIFKEWKTTDKLPIGTLIDVIGDIGNKDAEIEHLRAYYEIKNNIWKIDNDKKKNDINMINQLENNCEDYKVFSIDPIGSKDIDDAFHFKYIDENNYEIGIHIASPMKFFENNLNEILNRVSTVYLPDKKYNMLPNIYADEIISLIESKKRFAISVIFKIKNHNIINYEIKETIVLNIKNYDYDTFDKIYMKDKNLMHFVQSTKYFFQLDVIDSHKLVEVWMIYTNKCIAKHLIENNYSNIILRTHQIKEKDEEINNDECLNHYLNIKNENAALYKIYEKENSKQYHEKLGNEYYTHFTSPIRRSVDFYIHMLLFHKIHNMEYNNLKEMIDKINIFTKKTRKFDRMIRRLHFLYEIKELEKNIETYAYVINITKNKLTLYIPEYNLEEKVVFKEYRLYEKIKIKLWVFTSFENIFDKLKIEIL